MVWVFMGFLIFFAFIIFAGVRHYHKIPVEFNNMASELGISLVRTWGPPDVAGPASPFRYGSFYEATYRDLAALIFSLVNNEGSVVGMGLTFRFIYPLSLSLFCAFNIDPFTVTTIQDEYRDIYLKRVDTGIEGLKAWAGEKDKSMLLLRGGDVYTRLEYLAGFVQGGNRDSLPGLRRAGFVVNDQGVTLLVAEAAMLNRDFVEEAFLLTQALSSSGFGLPSRLPIAASPGFKVWVIILLVLFMGFIIGVMIIAIFKVKIATIFSIWG